jgi:HK97 family phage portal protein
MGYVSKKQVINKAVITPIPAEMQPGDNNFVLYWPPMATIGTISVETAKKLSTVYRCMNILSDDIAALPFQQFERLERGSRRVKPDGDSRNVAYLIEIEPNRWQTPFVFKKRLILDLLGMGNAYAWRPVSTYPEIYHLEASKVRPVFDKKGNRYFQVLFDNGEVKNIPDPEILQLMINPDKRGMFGRSVLGYASDTISRQIGANNSRNTLMGNGLLPTAILKVNGAIGEEARQKVKDSYLKSATDGVMVQDNAILDFKQITMNASDVQFLESIQATEVEIANYFGLPQYRLNLGKQSYQSNEQQQLDYLGTTLNPYLVQFEQSARLKWLATEDQDAGFFRFERKALMQLDTKTQAEFLHTQILDGIYSPNEARAINDLEPYPGGDQHYFPGNMAVITDKGLIMPGKETL